MKVADPSRRIGRAADSASISLTTSEATTPEIVFANAAGAAVFIPTGSSITTLTYYAAPAYGGTYLPLHDSTGAAVTQTVAAAKAYDVPAACFGCGALRIKANAAGSVELSLKG